jgi:hypothetical protein
MFGLYLFGRDIEDLMGTPRFLLFYLACGIAGGLAWLGTMSSDICIGAYGAIFGLLAAYAAFYPGRRITLLLFFVLPVTMTALTLAMGLAVVSFYIVLGGGGSVAHTAHLAGGVAGYLYAVFLRRKYQHHLMAGLLAGRPLFGGISAGMRKYFVGRKLMVLDQEDDDWVPDQEEVDEILDKISTYGIGSLTADERSILDRASKKGTR